MMTARALLALGLGVTIAGCSSSGSDDGGAAAAVAPPSGGSANVVQGGPQDFAEFRAIVAAGGIPAPETLDPVGFFAEHAMDLPPADCGQDQR